MLSVMKKDVISPTTPCVKCLGVEQENVSRVGRLTQFFCLGTHCRDNRTQNYAPGVELE